MFTPSNTNNIYNQNNNYTHRTHNNFTDNDYNKQTFHDQLQEILNIFPPLITAINIDNNPEKQLSDLYQIFVSNQASNNIYIPPSQQQSNIPNHQYNDINPCDMDMDINSTNTSNNAATSITYSPPSNPSINNNIHIIDNRHNNIFNNNNTNTFEQSNNQNVQQVTVSDIENSSYTSFVENMNIPSNNEDSNTNNNNERSLYNTYCKRLNTNENSQLIQLTHINEPPIHLYSRLEKAKWAEINSIRRRVKLRIEKIIDIVNDAMYRINNNENILYNSQFIINKLFVEYIMMRVGVCFSSWTGGKNFNIITEQKICDEKARKYWSRSKIVSLGNDLFGPVLIMIFEYIMKQNHLNIEEMILLYIDIIYNLVLNKVKYARTKPKPLIMLACYWKPSQFRDICANVIHCFGRNIKFDPIKQIQVQIVNGKRIYKYIKDQNRSQDLHDEFQKLLRTLKQQLLINSDSNFLNHAVETFTKTIYQL
eukprot:261055_1